MGDELTRIIKIASIEHTNAESNLNWVSSSRRPQEGNIG